MPIWPNKALLANKKIPNLSGFWRY